MDNGCMRRGGSIQEGSDRAPYQWLRNLLKSCASMGLPPGAVGTRRRAPDL